MRSGAEDPPRVHSNHRGYGGAMRKLYLEGRCRRCGRRVTVDREAAGHGRDGQWCGPVETEHPSAVSDEPTGNEWMVLRSG